MGHDEHRERDRREEQEDCLDDLHPRRREHPAEQHVDEHQHADPDDGDVVADPGKEQIDERADADHLRDEVEERDRDRRECGDGAYAAPAQPERDEVGHRVLAGVPQRFCHEEEHREVCHEPSDRIHEAVESVECDETGDAEKRSRRYVVARDRPAVLQAADAPMRGIEAATRRALPGCPIRHDQRDADEDREHHERLLGDHCWASISSCVSWRRIRAAATSKLRARRR